MEYERVYQMSFSKIYGLLLNKAMRKNRTKGEVDQIILWLTGYSQEQLDDYAGSDLAYGAFFQQAPCPNPNRRLIRGVVCGVRVETIEPPLMQEIRYLDKLIDELSKGKPMDKILREHG